MKTYSVTITTKDGWERGLEYKAKSISDALYKYSVYLTGLYLIEKFTFKDILSIIIKNVTDNIIIEEFEKE